MTLLKLGLWVLVALMFVVAIGILGGAGYFVVQAIR